MKMLTRRRIWERRSVPFTLGMKIALPENAVFNGNWLNAALSVRRLRFDMRIQQRQKCYFVQREKIFPFFTRFFVAPAVFY
jgi:hypothetical protein